jgi:hypothetical protein
MTEEVTTKRRATYLLISDWNLLNNWCKSVREMFNDCPFLVGSCLEKPDYRDVDVRLILADEEFDRLFPDHHDEAHPTNRLRYFNLAMSIWGQKVTGLPVDFQVQKMSEANELYGGRTRNSLGMKLW